MMEDIAGLFDDHPSEESAAAPPIIAEEMAGDKEAKPATTGKEIAPAATKEDDCVFPGTDHVMGDIVYAFDDHPSQESAEATLNAHKDMVVMGSGDATEPTESDAFGGEAGAAPAPQGCGVLPGADEMMGDIVDAFDH
jgi:hypothetical protein